MVLRNTDLILLVQLCSFLMISYNYLASVARQVTHRISRSDKVYRNNRPDGTTCKLVLNLFSTDILRHKGNKSVSLRFS